MEIPGAILRSCGLIVAVCLAIIGEEAKAGDADLEWSYRARMTSPTLVSYGEEEGALVPIWKSLAGGGVLGRDQVRLFWTSGRGQNVYCKDMAASDIVAACCEKSRRETLPEHVAALIKRRPGRKEADFAPGATDDQGCVGFMTWHGAQIYIIGFWAVDTRSLQPFLKALSLPQHTIDFSIRIKDFILTNCDAFARAAPSAGA